MTRWSRRPSSAARRQRAAVTGYRVVIDDNFRYMDESERVKHGVFGTADEAIAACKQIVDECLEPMMEPGMTAKAFYEQYEDFGDEPFIVSIDPNDAPVAFSARRDRLPKSANFEGVWLPI